MNDEFDAETELVVSHLRRHVSKTMRPRDPNVVVEHVVASAQRPASFLATLARLAAPASLVAVVVVAASVGAITLLGQPDGTSSATSVDYADTEYFGGASEGYVIHDADVRQIGVVESGSPAALTGEPVFALEGVDPTVAIAVWTNEIGEEAYRVFWAAGQEYPQELCRYRPRPAADDPCAGT